MKKLLLSFLFLSFLSIRSQDFLGMQSSDFAGVPSILSNPGNLAENRMKFDLVMFGINFNFDNNYVGVKREALDGYNPFKWFQGGTWDSTRKGSNDYWKNNLTTIENGKTKSINSALRIMLPSFMVEINRKNAIAFNWGVRNYVNIDGIGPDLAKLAYEEFGYPSGFWTKNLNNKKFSVNQMAWAEYGLSYGRVLHDQDENYLKAGATVKLLQGLEAAYMNIENLDFNFLTSDTVSLFQSDVSYGHSSNLDPFFDVLGDSTLSGKEKMKKGYKYESNPGLGFDFGLVYEWRPKYKQEQYDMDGKTGLWRNDHNKYAIKFSAAVNDIGGIRFKKGQLSNDFHANVNYWDLNVFNKVKSVNAYDSVLTQVFGSKESESTFKMALPTSINVNADFHIWKPFYINLMGNFANLQKNKITRVHDFTNISLTPRLDAKWIGLSFPMSYNTAATIRNEPVMFGAMLRLGPLMVGSNNVSGLFKKDLYGVNLYAMLKLPIPYGRPRDRDKDKISDKMDKCKTVPGVWEFMGCPDIDGDHIQDSEDKCPTIPGLKELQGCPDKDGDGIIDQEDECPDDKGTKEFNGCPDRDGDKIVDKKDSCPDIAGLKEFDGCPDKDGDGISDKMDECPDVFGPKEFNGCPDKDGDGTPDSKDACPDVPGPKEYKGCPDKDADGLLDHEDSCPDIAGPKENKGCPWPDTDKDGFLDKDDACPTVAGSAEYKGCPPPPPMKPAELKIIERAFQSLEFATGKDIIKPKSFPSLNDLAKILVSHKGNWKLQLSGHTDNDGTAASNMILSEKRSKAVKNYLVKKGVLADNVMCDWHGDTKPIADNATAAGKQKNRRVEMKIITKE